MNRVDERRSSVHDIVRVSFILIKKLTFCKYEIIIYMLTDKNIEMRIAGYYFVVCKVKRNFGNTILAEMETKVKVICSLV